MTKREALVYGTAFLERAGAESPALDGALLLARVVGGTRADLITRTFETLSAPDAADYERLLRRRAAGECVAYILGQREFWGLDFLVTKDVLVPRPDTETLVEAALGFLMRRPGPAGLSLLDMGAGSGAVGIALKHAFPAASLLLADISPAALAVAQENALRLLGGANPAPRFAESDLFDRIPEADRFDCVTANLPYIPSDAIDTLAQEVRNEPRRSLDGGRDGLDIIRRCVKAAKPRLLPGGALFLEADPRQTDAVETLLRAAGYTDIRTFRDMSGRPRVIGASA
ncbi:MAG: peptide chain release factor N(5)-glutamine methyltransferase [Spirochaetaceae bacterium]|jgi:release factor glutamine methyltransferase|nr:peptide chain release factor N(5)-glutamine methyltransferase [Spirochaetaceae bacterium]